MNNQYFGDVKDYYKYGLIRHLCTGDEISTTVCWMLTLDDNTGYKADTDYLKIPTYARFDPELYAALGDFVNGGIRNVIKIQQSGILPNCIYNTILPDGGLRYFTHGNRDIYMEHFRGIAAGRDLVFFDPDVGIKVPSRAADERYLLKEDVLSSYLQDASVLIFQYSHLDLRKDSVRKDVIKWRAVDCVNYLNRNIDIPITRIYSYASPHVLFILISRPRHMAYFEARADAFMGTTWNHGPKNYDGMIMNPIYISC